MIPPEGFTLKKYRFTQAEALLSLGLFLLALIPRAYALSRFVTADEAKWIYRSAQFLAAFLESDLAGTTVNLTPAVTTTWLGGIGLWLYYGVNSATIGQPLPAWLHSLPEFQPDLAVLVATRWPMVIFTSLSVVIIYRVARPLVGFTPALLGAGLIALDPHLIALSRILGHDAPEAIFMTLALLLFLKGTIARPDQTAPSSALPWVILSGVMAGLAFLSKAPAFFLIPFIGLLALGHVWLNPRSLLAWGKTLLLWSLAAYLTFTLFWPAAWIDPVGRPVAVVENAFLSATDTEEAEAENYWRVPDLGPFYYLVNGAFKLSPLVLVGLGLACWGLVSRRKTPLVAWSPAEKTTGWLLLFILLFTLFMSLGEKRSARYLLPIFPAAGLVAAFGWLTLYQFVLTSRKLPLPFRPNSAPDVPAGAALKPASTWLASPVTLSLVLLSCAFIILLPYGPYYFTYFNPLLGGNFTAPYLVKVGWGEGLDQVGRYLQRVHSGSRVGAAYASTISPFFEGSLSQVDGDQLDLIVLYRKQIQSGEPSPAFIRYFEQMPSLFSVNLNGLNYAKVYSGPALRPVSLEQGDSSQLTPIAFRPLTPFGSIGEVLEVDVLWEAQALEPVALTLQSPAGAETTSILAESVETPLRQPGDESLIISRHRLPLPETVGRGTYTLAANGASLGEIDLRHFRVPLDMTPVEQISFNHQIALRGYQFEPTSDYVGVTLAWQAQQAGLPDYTVFVQLLEAETNERLAGIDTQPLQGAWPTSRWVKGEVVVDEYLVAVPPELKPGFYKVIVGLYRPETGQRLTLVEGQDSWLVPWTFIRKE